MPTSKLANLGVDLYRIAINDGGTIEFNTGAGTGGGVEINGNLTVTGDFTQRSTNDLVIEDNLITLNNGETGNGISETTSGLVIDRGNFADVTFLYDEDLNWYDSQIGLSDAFSGAFALRKGGITGGETGSLVGLFTNFIGTFNDYDLVFLGENNLGKVTVTGTSDYETRIWNYAGDGATIPENPSVPGQPLRALDFNDDTLVNVRGLIDYVSSYLNYNFQDKIVSPTPNGDTRVVASDFDVTGNASKVEIIIDSSTVADFKQTKIQFTNLEFEDNAIRPLSNDANLVLEGDNAGSVEFGTPAYFPKYVDPLPGVTDPAAPVDGVKIYSKEQADGGTGIFFINENSTQDELISRNKALLYSIIF